MACRSVEKAQEAKDALKKEFANAETHLDIVQVDVSDEKTFQSFHDNIKNKYG
jgi:hypothetical protein